jgi:hypothetical protein
MIAKKQTAGWIPPNQFVDPESAPLLSLFSATSSQEAVVRGKTYVISKDIGIIGTLSDTL